MVYKSGSDSSNNRSAKVTREGNALSLERVVFTWKDPKVIALSAKNSPEASVSRKAGSFRSAMLMLVFYNRAGKNLGIDQRQVLEELNQALREFYGRERLCDFGTYKNPKVSPSQEVNWTRSYMHIGMGILCIQ